MIVTDTHKAIRTLVDNGFSDTQAECLINTLNTHGTEVVTKTDLKAEIAGLEARLTWKMIGLFSLFTVIFTIIDKSL
ncbi:MAG: hypothetical protein OXN26_16460 [Gammaproteobacteria bacterium]|nr:hypothetical protein [Gammaproteobacteria bacterium]